MLCVIKSTAAPFYEAIFGFLPLKGKKSKKYDFVNVQMRSSAIYLPLDSYDNIFFQKTYKNKPKNKSVLYAYNHDFGEHHQYPDFKYYIGSNTCLNYQVLASLISKNKYIQESLSEKEKETLQYIYVQDEYCKLFQTQNPFFKVKRKIFRYPVSCYAYFSDTYHEVYKVKIFEISSQGLSFLSQSKKVFQQIKINDEMKFKVCIAKDKFVYINGKIISKDERRYQIGVSILQVEGDEWHDFLEYLNLKYMPEISSTKIKKAV